MLSRYKIYTKIYTQKWHTCTIVQTNFTRKEVVVNGVWSNNLRAYTKLSRHYFPIYSSLLIQLSFISSKYNFNWQISEKYGN